MTGSSRQIGFLTIFHLYTFLHANHTYVNLSEFLIQFSTELFLILIWVAKVFVCHETFLVVEDKGIGVLIVYNHSYSGRNGFCDTFVGYYSMVHLTACIKRNHTLLSEGLSLNSGLLVRKTESETERTAVKNLINGIALRIDNILSSVCKQGSCASTESRSYLVAVHTCAVVYMVALCIIEFGGKIFIAHLAQTSTYFGKLLVFLQCITLLKYKAVGILCPDVIAPCTFTTLLKCWSIGTESNPVVFPGEIIYTFRILTSEHTILVFLRSTFLCIINYLAFSTDTNLENQFSVISHLAWYLLAVGIGNNKLLCTVEFLYNRGNGHFSHFSIADS